MPEDRGRYDTRTLTSKKEEVAVSFGAFDKDDERSLINLLPPAMRKLVEKAITPELGGDIRFISWSERRLEQELTKEIPKFHNDPSRRLDPIDHMIRLSFWNEYYRAQDTNQLMQEKNIFRNITFREDLHRRMRLPLYTAWLISPPKNLAIQQEETLMHAMRLLRSVVTNAKSIWSVKEVIKENHDGTLTTTREKKLNTQAVAEVRKIAEDLANRRQGSVVQKHQVVTAQLPPTHITPTQKAIPQAETREDLEAEIQELEAAIEEKRGGDVVEGGTS